MQRWTAVSLGLLLLVALLLFLPLLGHSVPVWAVAGLLLARLAVQVRRAQLQPTLRRPAAWLLDALLIGLLVYSAQGRAL